MSTIATINGTDAADTITFTATSTTVNAGEGANTITGTSGDNEVNAGGGVDTISLTSGDNTILAGAGANTITATLGNNEITSGDGADTITVTSGNNTINAGGGANTIVATSGINVINTGDGADTITTGGVAGGGNTINAGDGANTITTGAGDDTVTGGNGVDTITTGAGNDVVYGGNGANTITTGAGNDTVYSGIDIDTITTGAGDDTIHITGGTDTIAAGADNDTLIADLSLATGAVSINALAGTVAAGYAGNISGLGIATFAGVENFDITSGDFNDTITTGDGTDVVHAGAGSDTVNLAGGNDEAIYTMAANTGASDVYQGGSGVDTLTLELTTAEWFSAAVQTDIANYLAFQAAHTDPITGEADNAVFQFTAFDLSASEFEALNVLVDGVMLDPTHEAFNDVATLNEDNTATAFDSVLINDDAALAYSVTLISGPAEGLLTFNPGLDGAPDGSYSFDPNDDFEDLALGETRDVSFVYEVQDAFHGPSQATVTITVTGSNDAPIITSGAFNATIIEPIAPAEVSTSGTIVFSDLDVTDMHVVSVTAPVIVLRDDAGMVIPNGPSGLSPTDISNLQTALVMAPDGNWSFDIPLAGGLDRLAEDFTITLESVVSVQDDSGTANDTSATQPLTITLVGTNDAPVAVADVATTEENTVVLIDVLANDSDPDTNDTLTIVSATLAASSGSVAIVGNQLEWNPGTDFDYLNDGETAPVVVNYVVSDGNGGNTPSTATITVTGTNDAFASVTSTGLIFSNRTTPLLVRSVTDTNNNGVPDQLDVSAVIGSSANSANIFGMDYDDLDGDGDVDFVGATYNGLAIFTNQGDTDNDGNDNFITSSINSSNGSGIFDVTIADFNGDGHLDITSVGSQYNEVLFGNGGNGDNVLNISDYTLSTIVSTPGGANVYGVDSGDLNGDGFTDFVRSAYYNGPLQIFYSDGAAGTFSTQVIEDAYDENSLGIDIGDIDGDGDLDFLLTRWGNQADVIYYNDGDTNNDGQLEFTTQVINPNDNNLEGELFDIDSDGDLDILLADLNGHIDIFFNDGGGSFSQLTLNGQGSGTYGLGVGDIDEDGDFDIVMASNSVGNTTVFVNNGDTNNDGVIDFTSEALAGIGGTWDVAFINSDEFVFG
jgi:hypothetical protein